MTDHPPGARVAGTAAVPNPRWRGERSSGVGAGGGPAVPSGDRDDTARPDDPSRVRPRRALEHVPTPRNKIGPRRPPQSYPSVTYDGVG
ncbi:hypothetical protein Pen01_59930 [Phytomonospora endophytica]|nr:hypothetical protein Pen01_59930 [Phytomonospora endophytica]